LYKSQTKRGDVDVDEKLNGLAQEGKVMRHDKTRGQPGEKRCERRCNATSGFGWDGILINGPLLKKV